MNNQLNHHGVKGMKWGVRKKVLEGGSKMAQDATKLGKGPKSKVKKNDYINMTDDELKKRVSRLNLEEQYGRLSGQTKRIRSGADWAHEVLQDSAIVMGMAGTAIGIYLALLNRPDKK